MYRKEPVPPGPPLRSLDEINMQLVEEAKEIRSKTAVVPVSAAAIELVRLLRATGAFEGRSHRNYPDSDYQQQQAEIA